MIRKKIIIRAEIQKELCSERKKNRKIRTTYKWFGERKSIVERKIRVTQGQWF